jgi:hypothetical protein
MTSLRIFSCFDPRDDEDLHGLLARQCEAPGSGLELVDWSRAHGESDAWEDGLRRRLGDVDAAIVICSEKTDSADHVNRELAILQQEDKPYVLLWGRRSSDCTRPPLARKGDHFYAWIWDILTRQVEDVVRMGREGEPAEEVDLGGMRGRSTAR